jgi:hypothetical protein
MSQATAAVQQPDVTFVAWNERGITLSKTHRRHQFEIADWLVEGIDLSGATATYDAAEGLFPQYHRQTFVSWVTVARHFPASMRIESEFLTFSHYQTAQGSCFKSESVLACELELVWLRKADELHMSVSVLREAIRNEAALSQRVALGPSYEPESTEPEPAPAPNAAKSLPPGQKQWEELPRWIDYKLKESIEELATARHCKPYVIVLRAIADFIDAHSDELGDARGAEAKRMDEHKASVAAAKAAAAVLEEKASEHRKMIALIDDAQAEYQTRRRIEQEQRRAAEQAARAEQEQADEQAAEQAAEQAILAEHEQAAIESDDIASALL